MTVCVCHPQPLYIYTLLMPCIAHPNYHFHLAQKAKKLSKDQKRAKDANLKQVCV